MKKDTPKDYPSGYSYKSSASCTGISRLFFGFPVQLPFTSVLDGGSKTLNARSVGAGTRRMAFLAFISRCCRRENSYDRLGSYHSFSRCRFCFRNSCSFGCFVCFSFFILLIKSLKSVFLLKRSIILLRLQKANATPRSLVLICKEDRL